LEINYEQQDRNKKEKFSDIAALHSGNTDNQYHIVKVFFQGRLNGRQAFFADGLYERLFKGFARLGDGARIS
jgi:hypothetical protein